MLNIQKRLFQCVLTFKKKNATIELLKSSVSVSVSGIFRVYLASILLQTEISIFTCIAGGLVIYSVYTLDRSLSSKEDIVNRKELSGSRKEIGLAASMLAFVIGSYVLEKEGLLALAFLPLVTGFLYSKGIKIGKFALKLKGGLGIKNLVVGLSWGIFITWLAGSTCKSFSPVIIVFIYMGIKVFVNSVIDDFKDIKGDILAGLRTIPVSLGETNTRNFLIGLHLLSHMIFGIALLKGVVEFEPLILAGSFFCGLICILRYTNDEKYISGKSRLTLFKDGESSLIVGSRMVLNAFFILNNQSNFQF